MLWTKVFNAQPYILLPATVVPPVVVSTATQEQLDTLHITVHKEQGELIREVQLLQEDYSDSTNYNL